MYKPQVIIIEDDPIISADLSDAVQEAGYEVIGPVNSGEQALMLLQQESLPDLALVDIRLEGEMNGIEAARSILAVRQMPVIFLTANSDENTFQAAKKLGPFAFLSKPFKRKDLKHALVLAFHQMQVNPGAQHFAISDEDSYIIADRIFVKYHDRMIRIFLSDILWVEADDYYCRIKTKEKEYLISQTMKKFYEHLSGLSNFHKVHRSYIVNILQISEFGDIFLIIEGNKIPCNRQAKEELLKKIRKV